MGKSASFAKSRMRENRNNQYRPEQVDMCVDLRKQFPEYSVLMEQIIRYKDESDRDMVAIPDILIVELGVVYRINGAIHNSNNQYRKDWEQRIYLENLGYLVIDIDNY